MKRVISGIFFFTLCFFLSGVPLANAAGSDESLLELLKRKGVLTDEEFARQKESLKKEQDALKQGLVGLRGKNIKVFGRIQPRYTFIGSDHNSGQDQTSNFSWRRARIGVMGDITKDIEFFMQYESASAANTTSLLDANVTFKHFDEWGRIIVGQQYIFAENINSSAKTMITEREFAKFIGPGQSGRGRGIALGKGGGMFGKGFFDDKLGYWLGIFNGPDLARDNENGDNLYSARISYTPFGGMTGDEYNVKFSPWKFQIAAGAATSRDSLTTSGAGTSTTIKATDKWYSADFQAEGYGWYFGSQWVRMSTDMASGSKDLDSDGYFAGLTKSFAMPNKGQFLGVGFVWQRVDNEHPGKTNFFGPRTATSRSTKGTTGRLTFNKGNSYHPVITYILAPNVRLQIEYAMYKEEDQKEIDNNTLFTQLTVDF